jgi:hypothetical protein
MYSTNMENDKMLSIMKDQLASGLKIVEGCQVSSANAEENVKRLNDKFNGVLMDVRQEASNRESAIHDVDFKIKKQLEIQDKAIQDVEYKVKRQGEVQKYDHEMLNGVLDSHVIQLQDAHSVQEKDIQDLHKHFKETKDWVNTHHEDTLKHLVDSKLHHAQSVKDECLQTLKEAKRDTEMSVHDLSNKLYEVKNRIAQCESIAGDTANKWSASHEQLKERINSNTTGLEQGLLQTRMTHAGTQEMKGDIELLNQAVNKLALNLKEEAARSQKTRGELLNGMQQNFDGALKSTFTELETRLFARIDQEADARTACILQALDDIGKVLEKEIPTGLRQEITKKPMQRAILDGSGQTIYFSTVQQSMDNSGMFSVSGASMGSTTDLKRLTANGSQGYLTPTPSSVRARSPGGQGPPFRPGTSSPGRLGNGSTIMTVPGMPSTPMKTQMLGSKSAPASQYVRRGSPMTK